MTEKKITAPRHITKDAIYAELVALKEERQQEQTLTVFSTRITKQTKERIRQLRLQTGKSVQDITEEAFATYLMTIKEGLHDEI